MQFVGNSVRNLGRFCEAGLIVGLCYLVGGSPTPSVNEPHYLGKARHYWIPEWCAGDFFLESADAHEVFYWSFGWVTQFLSLPQSAWLGRLIVWTFFAVAWLTLVRSVTRARWAGLLSAILLLPLIHYGHLAGEWLIGGVEAKGFAWPFVFLGIASAVQGRWPMVWPLLGIASSFHILVGGWAVIACLIAWQSRRRIDGLSWQELAVWLVIGGLCSLPGLIPALQLTSQSTAEELREANLTYTFRRLSHHLVFYRFANWNPWSPSFNIIRPVSFAALVFVWWRVSRWHPRNDRLSRLRAIVNASLCIACVGIVLDVVLGPFHALRASVLRYYWFRLSDILVAAGVAILTTTSLEYPERLRRSLLFGGIIVAAFGIGGIMPKLGFGARSTALQQQSWRGVLDGVDVHEIDDAWLDICRWVKDASHLPQDAIFLTPTRQQTFKWYAQRPDVVTWKDVPQDAAGLNAWWARREAVYELGDWPWDHPEACANVIEAYGVTHVIWPVDQGDGTAAEKQPPGEVQQVYRNDLFRIFALPR